MIPLKNSTVYYFKAPHVEYVLYTPFISRDKMDSGTRNKDVIRSSVCVELPY